MWFECEQQFLGDECWVTRQKRLQGKTSSAGFLPLPKGLENCTGTVGHLLTYSTRQFNTGLTIKLLILNYPLMSQGKTLQLYMVF